MLFTSDYLYKAVNTDYMFDLKTASYISYTPNNERKFVLSKKDCRHSFTMEYIDGSSLDIITWCIEHFGMPKRSKWSYSNSMVFYICSVVDAMAFKLRWI